MPTNGDSLAEKAQASYRKLANIASELNFVSDNLGKSIAELDESLKKLNLGLHVWVRITSYENGGYEWADYLGYAKVDGKWGIALSTVFLEEPEGDESSNWLFNDAPRAMRLAAIGKIPDLLEALSGEGQKMVREAELKLGEVTEVIAAVKKMAEEPIRRIIAKGPSQPQEKKTESVGFAEALGSLGEKK